jgi:hypothetical protein
VQQHERSALLLRYEVKKEVGANGPAWMRFWTPPLLGRGAGLEAVSTLWPAFDADKERSEY